MNFLVTAVGSLASDIIIKVLRENFHKSRIFGTDIYPKEWLWESSLVDQFFQVPLASDSSYINTLLQICSENQVNFIIPLIDPEVDSLSDSRQPFNYQNITLCIASKEMIKTCRNKLNLYNAFINDTVVSVIPTYLEPEPASKNHGFPLICKPLKGRSSEGVIKISDALMGSILPEHLNHTIFQPFISGDIFTVDAVRDRYGNCTCITRKELIRNKIGAGITVKVLKHSELEETTSYIAAKIDALGAFNVEFIFDGNKYYVMDINPRFSAGIEYTVLSGYDIVKNNLLAFMNEKIEPRGSLKEQIYLKHYHTHFH
ncbi:MAG: ATP-grasp domain-containing protein [Balneolaceae bacterium]|nr:MAG: ATP-grasp domain-containing protein [Balneolaceae bacterium]